MRWATATGSPATSTTLPPVAVLRGSVAVEPTAATARLTRSSRVADWAGDSAGAAAGSVSLTTTLPVYRGAAPGRLPVPEVVVPPPGRVAFVA